MPLCHLDYICSTRPLSFFNFVSQKVSYMSLGPLLRQSPQILIMAA